MIYWHVEKNSVCVYSQLKVCSSSEVAAMIEGVLRHDTRWTWRGNTSILTARAKWGLRSAICWDSHCCRD